MTTDNRTNEPKQTKAKSSQDFVFTEAQVEAAAKALHRRIHPGGVWWADLPESHRNGWRDQASAALAAADAHLPSVDGITIPKPYVPFGPVGMTEDEATAHYLREIVEKIDSGYMLVGGSNVTATVRNLLLDTADALFGEVAGDESHGNDH